MVELPTTRDVLNTPAIPPSLVPSETMTWLDFSDYTNPLGSPPSFAKAMRNYLVRDEYSPTDKRDMPALRAALASYHEISGDAIFCGSTIAEMMSFVARAQAPCTVGVVTPGRDEYTSVLLAAGHAVRSLKNPTGFVMVDPEQAEQTGPTFEAAVLANPCFPTSRLLPKKTLIRYLEKCRWVIVDERSIEFTLGGESMVNLTAEYENLVVVRSLIETFSMQGMPMSYCVAHPHTIAALAHANHEFPQVSQLAQVLVEAALKEAAHIEHAREILDTEIPWLQCMLSLTPGIDIFPAEANYVLCTFRTHPGLELGVSDTSELSAKLENAGFLIRQLVDVPGLAGNDYFCVAVRTHSENERLVTAIRHIVCGA